MTVVLGIVLITAMFTMGEAINARAAEDELDVTYSGHMEGYGNLAAVKNGSTLGSIPSDRRLEAITIDSGVSLTYQVHVQDIGWQEWKTNGQQAGTTGRAKRLEAIKIKLTGKEQESYDIYYRVHLANAEWLSWAKNGETAGTSGYGAKLDGIQIRIVAKTHTAPDDTSHPYLDAKNPAVVSYSGHIQNIGNVSAVNGGATLGTVGMGRRIEAVTLSLANTDISGGLSYRVHGQDYGWQSYRSEGQQAGTTGQAKRIEAVEISLTGDISKYYDVYYRVHIQDFGWLDWAKNGATAGSTGIAKRLEAIQIKLVPKGGVAPGNTDTPYVKEVKTAFSSSSSRIVSGIGNVDLWIGDSRFVGLGGVIYGYPMTTESYHSNVVARVSANYAWLNSTGYSLIAARLRANPNAVVVANFGLNDISNQANYLNVYKRLHADFPNAKLCIMSVNPVGTNFRYSNNYGYYQTFTQNIKAFNAYMLEHVADFDGYYIDTFNNCDLPTGSDGIHYANSVYWTIYHYVTGL